MGKIYGTDAARQAAYRERRSVKPQPHENLPWFHNPFAVLNDLQKEAIRIANGARHQWKDFTPWVYRLLVFEAEMTERVEALENKLAQKG